MELKYIIVSPRNSSGGAKVLLNLYNIMDDLGLDVQMYLLDKVPTYKKNYFEYMLKFYLWTFVDIIKDRIKYSKMISHNHTPEVFFCRICPPPLQRSVSPLPFCSNTNL